MLPAIAHDLRTAAPLALLVPALGFLLFSSTGADDAYISHWAALSLARTGSILNYNGALVEQSSSLTQVVLVALMARLTGADVPSLTAALSVVCGLLTVLGTFVLARQVSPHPGLAAVLVATSPIVLHWSFSGLETSLAMLCGTWLLVLTSRWADGGGRFRAIMLIPLLLAFAAVRPEAPIVLLAWVAGLYCVMVLKRRDPELRPASGATRRIAAIAALSAGAVAVLFVFRWAYFGDLFPQPVAAKHAGPTVDATTRGVTYLVQYVTHTYDVGIWAGAAAGAFRIAWLWRFRPYAGGRTTEYSLVTFAMAGIGFVILSGGDWMRWGRFLVPLVPSAAVLTIIGIQGVANSRLRAALVVAVVCQQLASTLVMAAFYSAGSPLWRAPTRFAGEKLSFFESRNRDYVREHLLGAWVRDFIPAGHRTRVMTGQMGMAAYTIASRHHGTTTFLDRFGLTDRAVTSCAWTPPLSTTTTGVELEYERFFAELPRLTEECGIEAPDVIFDLDWPGGPRRRTVEANGYQVVYEQHGSILNGSKVFPGLTESSTMFVAVHRDFVSHHRPFVVVDLNSR